MLVDRINLNHLRVFECVFRHRSMTAAAGELRLTQSGVSQHIRALEGNLGIRLFDRVKLTILPTAQAKALFEQVEPSLLGIEQSLESLQGSARRVSGSVAIGMPIEFGNNVLLGLLAKACEKHPAIQFSLRYGFATEMNQGILAGDLDFAFIDSFAVDRRIRTEKVYDEELHLCASLAFAKQLAGRPESAPVTAKDFQVLPIVDYQPGAPLASLWFQHHFGKKPVRLRPRVHVMDVQGVARLILEGVGVGILPGHLVEKLRREGTKLHVFPGSARVLKNAISVAYLEERTRSRAAAAVFELLVRKLGY